MWRIFLRPSRERDSATEHDLARNQENLSRIASRCLRKFPRRRTATRRSMDSFGKEDSTNRAEIAELLRFNTSNSGDEQISSEEHVDRMKKRAERHLLHYGREHRSTCLRHLSWRTCVRSVLSHCTWWAPWMTAQGFRQKEGQIHNEGRLGYC